MSERAWYVGLACRRCGQRVKVSANEGRYVQPVQPNGKLGEPWAEHVGPCDGGLVKPRAANGDPSPPVREKNWAGGSSSASRQMETPRQENFGVVKTNQVERSARWA